MVCVRCKMAVRAVLEAAEIPYLSIELGKIKLPAALSATQRTILNKGLKHYQLELMENKVRIFVERIKTEINNLLHSPNSMHLKLSAHLSMVLGYNYTYLSNTFSELEGITLERYFITQRVERVKELLVYEDLSLTRIADKLSYSNVSHLCLQFKKVTGITPAQFKRRCQAGDYVWREV